MEENSERVAQEKAGLVKEFRRFAAQSRRLEQAGRRARVRNARHHRSDLDLSLRHIEMCIRDRYAVALKGLMVVLSTDMESLLLFVEPSPSDLCCSAEIGNPRRHDRFYRSKTA